MVKVQLTKPKDFKQDIEIEIQGETHRVQYVNTGVPHAILFLEDVKNLDVQNIGAKVRFHEKFKPSGTNVNFVSISRDGKLHLRTYERGVEAETYACGTGAAASAYVAHKLGYTNKNEVPVITSGGEKLTITIGEKDTLYLTGGATLVYEGKLNPHEIGL